MATRQNLLSPEELSALSEGLKDGTLESDTGFNTGVRVRKHDLASENSSLGVNVSSNGRDFSRIGQDGFDEFHVENLQTVRG